MRLKNKVAIITGAGRGIGQATAVKFAHEGANVVVCDLSKEAIADTLTLCKLAGAPTLGCVANVTDMNSLEAMVKTTLAEWGRIDILVNNAGIVSDAQMKNMTEDQFDKVIAVNLKGVFNATKAVVNTMIAQQSGVILNSSSIVGLYGNFGQTNYAASKFGVIGMVKTWARELGRKGIRANAVCPGFITTSILGSIPVKVIKALEEKVPMGRLGKPEDVANTFAFLASDEASYINGAVIEVSGGLII
jgi:3-oxoacyl-[acyl-carrier protein] reductase